MIQTLKFLDLLMDLLTLVWTGAVLVALTRHWIKWEFIGPFQLVGHIWRGEIGPR